MLDSAKLITRCQQGDLRAFATLFDHYQDELFDLAWTTLGDREAAKDAVQDTFLTLFQKIDTFRGQSAFDTWLTAVLINECRQKLRYRHGMGCAQIAEILGLSVNTVYEQLSQSRQRLRLLHQERQANNLPVPDKNSFW